MPASAFISYCRDDSGFALRLAQDLKAAGASVWLDQLDIIPGHHWDNAIEDALLDASQMLIILSPASARSTNVRDEIAYALEQGKIIIPVLYMDCAVPLRLQRIQRIDFRADYARGLASLLIQFRVDHPGPTQAAAVEAERLSASVKQERYAPNVTPKSPSDEPAVGAVDVDSLVYVDRPADQRLRQLLEGPGRTIIIKGAPQVGKTSMLFRALDHAITAGRKVVLLDLQIFDASTFETLEKLFRALGGEIANQLGLDKHPHDMWNSYVGPKLNFDRYMATEVLPKVGGDLILAIDELDRLFNSDFVSDVFALLRVWHMHRASPMHSKIWRRFSLVIVTSSDPYLYINEANQSPFNVGELLQLQDFDLQEVEKLNELYGSPIKFAADMGKFEKLFDGHPYLTRKGLAELTRTLSMDQLVAVADTEEGPFINHLRGILATITRDEQMTESIKQLLLRRPATDADSLYRLDRAGIINLRQQQNVEFRCKIYETYLSRHLMTRN